MNSYAIFFALVLHCSSDEAQAVAEAYGPLTDDDMQAIYDDVKAGLDAETRAELLAMIDEVMSP